MKETVATISENYSLSKPSLENEILTLKNKFSQDPCWARIVL
jgi:hypothetical protein